jgi:hypothetical protein
MKIKVFDTKSKCFVDISGYKRAVLLTSDGYEMSTGYDGFDNPTFGTNDSEGYQKMTEKEFSDYQNRFKYLQCVGKKDKNGNDVFNGDFDAEGNVVVWCENCNGWEFGALDIPTNEICIPCHRCDGNFFFEDQIGDFEVIGNTCQNAQTNEAAN